MRFGVACKYDRNFAAEQLNKCMASTESNHREGNPRANQIRNGTQASRTSCIELFECRRKPRRQRCGFDRRILWKYSRERNVVKAQRGTSLRCKFKTPICWCRGTWNDKFLLHFIPGEQIKSYSPEEMWIYLYRSGLTIVSQPPSTACTHTPHWLLCDALMHSAEYSCGIWSRWNGKCVPLRTERNNQFDDNSRVTIFKGIAHANAKHLALLTRLNETYLDWANGKSFGQMVKRVEMAAMRINFFFCSKFFIFVCVGFARISILRYFLFPGEEH